MTSHFETYVNRLSNRASARLIDAYALELLRGCPLRPTLVSQGQSADEVMRKTAFDSQR